MKAIHIHTDQKFVFETSIFEGEYFDNVVALIGKHNNYKGPYEEKILFFDYSPLSLPKIIKLCNNADLVVLYGLDVFKCRVIMNLPTNTKIAWRFFGYELYGKEAHYYLSKLTQASLIINKTQLLTKLLLDTAGSLYANLKWTFRRQPDFMRAIKRVDFFLCYCQEEYDFLKKRWPTLPCFVKLPIPHSYSSAEIFPQKKRLIIIGNNRSSYNNNLDVINMIESSENRSLYQFILLFNYGSESNYTRKVRDMVKNKLYYKIINDYLPVDSFNNLYQEVSAAVFNGYRQMALANIFSALQYGVKLYLNGENVIMQWLKNEGFVIYSIDDLIYDLKSLNVALSEADIKHNVGILQKLIKSYTKDDFQKQLVSLINERTNEKQLKYL